MLTQTEFDSLKQGDPISIQYSHGGSGSGWRFGGIDKSLPRQLAGSPS